MNYHRTLFIVLFLAVLSGCGSTRHGSSESATLAASEAVSVAGIAPASLDAGEAKDAFPKIPEYILKHPLTIRYLSPLFHKDLHELDQALPVSMTQAGAEGAFEVLFDNDHRLSVKLLTNAPSLNTQEDCLAYFQDAITQGTFASFECYHLNDGFVYQWEELKNGVSYYTTILSDADSVWQISESGSDAAAMLIRKDSTAHFAFSLDRRSKYWGERYNYLFWLAEKEVFSSYMPDPASDSSIPFRFDIKACSVVMGEFTTEYDLQLSAFHPDDHAPFQTLRFKSIAGYSPLSFEDVNMDGFPDCCIQTMASASNGSFIHYIWSPSKRRFIEAEGLQGFGSSHYTDPGRDTFHEHIHGSAIGGAELTYRWIDESHAELIRVFDHDGSWNDDFTCTITDFSGGKETVLLNWTGTTDEYLRNYLPFFALDNTDILWESSFSAPRSGETIFLYYGEIPHTDDAGKLTLYECNLFAVGANGDFFRHFTLTNTHPCRGFSRDDKGDKPAIVIRYADSSTIRIHLETLSSSSEADASMPENLDLSAFDTSQLDQFLLADLDGDGNPELLMNDHDGSTGTKPPWFRIFSLNLDSSNPRADEKEVFLQDVGRVPPYSSHGFPDFMHGLCYTDVSSGD